MNTFPLNTYSPYNSDGGRGTLTPSSVVKDAVGPDCISFEVLYVGKLRIESVKAAPVWFVDEALEAFKSHDVEKGRREPPDLPSPKEEEEEGLSSQQKQRLSTPPPPSSEWRLVDEEEERKRRTEEVTVVAPPGPLLVKSLSLPVEERMRSRALSTGDMRRRGGGGTWNHHLHHSHLQPSSNNRTMILIVGKGEMKLISPDAKTLLFSKHFRDIYQSSQGIKEKEYFGFICREGWSQTVQSPSPHYVAFIFRCQSDSVAGDVLKVLRQAAAVVGTNLKKDEHKSTPVLSCDHCPILWYRHLCSQLDGLSCDERVQLMILKYMGGLVEEDGERILAKFHEAEGPSTTREENERLMSLLRLHCERKQMKHIHDTAQNRTEFLDQYLGGGTIFLKAKRSLTNSLDQLMKRKGGRLQEDSPLGDGDHEHHHHHHQTRPPQVTEAEEEDMEEAERRTDIQVLEDVNTRPHHPHRQRSSTLGALSADSIKGILRNRRTSSQFQPPPPLFNQHDRIDIHGGPLKTSPIMSLFQKVGGSQSKPGPSTDTTSNATPPSTGSWRHAIFKKVVSPQQGQGTTTSVPTTQPSFSNSSTNPPPPPTTTSSSSKSTFEDNRSPDQLRQLWKTAINQQIILIRMEKQNIRIKAKQEEADVKRMKLSYVEVGTCDQEANDTWDLIISLAAGSSQKADLQLLNSALLRGIPQHKRGQVWEFLIQQRRKGEKGGRDGKLSHLNLDRPYEELLRQLTSQQHAILIDLGRTFPSVAYFRKALGSGQLALFNLLKAYSLLDTDVGYCQGLSFVAGLLLLHLEEEEAFAVLKYIMFDLGAREHYKPDMHELQVKLYQLTRLIHDQDEDVLLLLNEYDVLPSLYAAPWFLTLFASQFSIGFCVRVLDVLLLHGVDVIAKFGVVIILDHKKELMECKGLEQVMDCFKTVVTAISSDKCDSYLRKVLESDWDKQMLTYAVEYSVMNDEAFHAFISESSSSSVSVAPSTKGTPTVRGKAADKKEAYNCVGKESKGVQTDCGPPPPASSGEKHPILGDLIQRQNSEISQLKSEKCEVRKDVLCLLDHILRLERMGRMGLGTLPVPPQVSTIASKYFDKSGWSYAELLEEGLTEGRRGPKNNNNKPPSILPPPPSSSPQNEGMDMGAAVGLSRLGRPAESEVSGGRGGSM